MDNAGCCSATYFLWLLNSLSYCPIFEPIRLSYESPALHITAMSLTTPSPKPASDRFNSIPSWRDNYASTASFDHVEDNQGIASRLYGSCVSCMHRICRHRGYVSFADQGWLMLREEMDAFFIWGRDLENERLEQALSLLDDLQDSVLECLVEIGKVLQRGKNFRWELASRDGNLGNNATDHLTCAACLGPDLVEFGSRNIFEELEKVRHLVEQKRPNVEEHPSNWVLPMAAYKVPPNSISMEGLTKELQPPIRYLIDLSPSIHQNLEIAALAEPPRPFLSSALMNSLDDNERVYATRIHEKFPKAPETLLHQLAKANWRRHVEVRSQELEADLMPEISSATSVAPFSLFTDSAMGTSISSISRGLTYSRSSESRISTSGQTTMRVPNVPYRGANGDPFRCPLCHERISRMNSRARWK